MHDTIAGPIYRITGSDTFPTDHDRAHGYSRTKVRNILPWALIYRLVGLQIVGICDRDSLINTLKILGQP